MSLQDIEELAKIEFDSEKLATITKKMSDQDTLKNIRNWDKRADTDCDLLLDRIA